MVESLLWNFVAEDYIADTESITADYLPNEGIMSME